MHESQQGARKKCVAMSAVRLSSRSQEIDRDLSKGWPPTLLTTGTRDLLLSDTVRLHRALRRADVIDELHVAEASPHGGFMGQAPEDREILAEARRFLYAAWKVDG